jgi:hypothetical protein
MPDASERERIRETFKDTPGIGNHVERASNELENAEAYGDESGAERARGELASFGYQAAGDRAKAEAAQARRDAAAARKDASHAAPEGRSASPPAKQSTAKGGE